MKHCKKCSFSNYVAVQNGPQMQMVDVCTNEECSNPVDGSPIPCQVARSNEVFCGIKAKYFKMVEEVVKEEKKDNIIQLVTH